jgi:hypothetical protein
MGGLQKKKKKKIENRSIVWCEEDMDEVASSDLISCHTIRQNFRGTCKSRDNRCTTFFSASIIPPSCGGGPQWPGVGVKRQNIYFCSDLKKWSQLKLFCWDCVFIWLFCMTLCTQKCLNLRPQYVIVDLAPVLRRALQNFLNLFWMYPLAMNDVAKIGQKSTSPKTFSPMTLCPVIIGQKVN